MYWVALLFGISFTLLGYVLLKALREAEESYAGEYTADTTRQFEDLFMFIPVKRMLIIARISALGTFLLLFSLVGNFTGTSGIVRGIGAGVFGALIMLFIPRILVRILKVRRLEKFNKQLVDALTSMSNALKAGFSIQQAFESIVQEGQKPISQEFGMFLQQLRVGMKFEDALADMDRRVGSEDLALMILSIETARQTGGNLTEIFDKIAATIRERRRIEGKIKSLTAQGRIQGRVVGAMPILLFAVLYAFIDPQMMKFFISSYAGASIILIVLLLEVCGAFMIRKIVNIDV